MSLPLLPSSPVSVANLIDALVGTLSTTLTGVVTSLVSSMQTAISVAVTTAVNAAVATLSATINAAIAAINATIATLSGLIGSITGTITGIINTALGAITTVINDILLFLQMVFTDVKRELDNFRFLLIVGIVVLGIIGILLVIFKYQENADMKTRMLNDQMRNERMERLENVRYEDEMETRLEAKKLRMAGQPKPVGAY